MVGDRGDNRRDKVMVNKVMVNMRKFGHNKKGLVFTFQNRQ